MRQLQITGAKIERADGSDVYPTVYIDGEGRVCGKAYNKADAVTVPEYVVDYDIKESMDALDAVDVHSEYIETE